MSTAHPASVAAAHLAVLQVVGMQPWAMLFLTNSLRSGGINKQQPSRQTRSFQKVMKIRKKIDEMNVITSEGSVGL